MSNPGKITSPAQAEAFVQASVASGWGQVKPTIELDLPSGSKVLIQELDIPKMIELGVLDQLDSFTGKVLPKEPKKGKKAKKEEEPEMPDGEQLGVIMTVMDKVVAAVLIEPKVEYIEDIANADPSKIYSNLIPLPDKMEIFNKGFASMLEFLGASGGQAPDLGNLAAGKNIQPATE